MLYLLLKSLHVSAMVAWIAAMIVAPLLLASGPDTGTAATLRRILVRLTSPAMFLTLGLGLWLAQEAGWFRAAWLQVKLALVLVLTGVHGVISGQARRMAATPGRGAALPLRIVPWIVVACVAAITVLVIVKPDLW